MSRLEEIKKVIPSIQKGMPKETLTWSGWKPVVTIFTEDSEYLLEQAKRAQELEEEIKTHAPHGRNYTNEQYVELRMENKRYKQALEQVWDMTKESIMDGRIYIVVDKALKGESE